VSSRHIFISNAQGVITELQRLQADEYIIRYHKSSAEAGFYWTPALGLAFAIAMHIGVS
jgi:hypothetical protein